MVTLEEVKEYLNIVGGDDDRILNREIVAGYDNREGGWAEGGAGMDPRARAMITQLQLYRKE